MFEHLLHLQLTPPLCNLLLLSLCKRLRKKETESSIEISLNIITMRVKQFGVAVITGQTTGFVVSIVFSFQLFNFNMVAPEHICSSVQVYSVLRGNFHEMLRCSWLSVASMFLIQRWYVVGLESCMVCLVSGL